jgi:hypothetical protein
MPAIGARENSGAEPWKSRLGEGKGDPRAEPRYACNHKACVASANRDIAIEARIVNISKSGAKVEVIYPRRGPSTTFLFDLETTLVYECEVLWRSDFHIGVRFLDVLGPSRRRKLQTGADFPLSQSSRQFIQLEEPPKEELQPGPPPPELFGGAPAKPPRESSKPNSGAAALAWRFIRKD